MGTAEREQFINTIGLIISRIAKERGYHVASPIIAQALVESKYGESSLGWKYHNYFGMKCGSAWKGKSVNLKTKEEYKVGVLTTIKDNFRVYDSMEEGVSGYFDFIASKRYANLKTATNPREYLEMIKADGYATSSTYVTTNLSYISRHNLTRFDFDVIPSNRKTNEEIAMEVINQKWGNGYERKIRLKRAGYDYDAIQKLVNQILSNKS